MKQTLKVVAIEILRSEKANCNFKKVTFRAFEDDAIVGTGVRNLWPKHEATDASGKTITINGDADYDIIQKGDVYAGNIVSLRTTDYLLNGRTVNSWKGVVFKLENPLAVCARNLRQHNAAPYDPETGETFTVAAPKAAPKSDPKAGEAAGKDLSLTASEQPE